MATENNDLPVRIYQKQFIGLMQTVFGVQSTFTPTFGMHSMRSTKIIRMLMIHVITIQN